MIRGMPSAWVFSVCQKKGDYFIMQARVTRGLPENNCGRKNLPGYTVYAGC